MHCSYFIYKLGINNPDRKVSWNLIGVRSLLYSREKRWYLLSQENSWHAIGRTGSHACHWLGDEAFGYLKRVILTPVVYPLLVEFSHFDFLMEWDLLVAELGDLDPITIIDGKGKEHNVLAEKNLINTVIALSKTPVEFSSSKKRKLSGIEGKNTIPPSSSICNVVLDSYCQKLLSESEYVELDQKMASLLNWSWTPCPITPKITSTLLEEAILVDEGKSLLILEGEIYSRVPSLDAHYEKFNVIKKYLSGVLFAPCNCSLSTMTMQRN